MERERYFKHHHWIGERLYHTTYLIRHEDGLDYWHEIHNSSEPCECPEMELVRQRGRGDPNERLS